MSRSFVRRAGALAAGGALLVSGLATTAPAHAAPGDDPVADAASWLTGQLTDGLVHGAWGPDYGLSIDVALSLAEVGGHDSDVEAVADAVAASVDQYIAYDFPPFEEGDDHYSGQVAGATAKGLRLAQTVGEGPEFGGVDLVERLETLVLTGGANDGRIADQAAVNGDPDPDGDYANVIGQAYAASTLAAENTATRDHDVIDFLLQQQCSDGFFRLYFNEDKAAADQSCDGGTADESAPDTDVTALVAVLLADLGDDPAVGAALDDVRSWLLDTQLADGSFGGGPTTAEPNSNSTGLAGWALGTLGEDAAAARAGAWVRAHQVVPIAPCVTALDSEVGAIAYDQAALEAGHVNGISVGAQDQWRRAGAQAAPALAWAPAFSTGDLTITDPRTFHRAGSTATFGVSGLSAGEAVCLSGRGLSGVGSSTGGDVASTITLPALKGNKSRVLTAIGASGAATTTTLTILGKKKLPLSLKKAQVMRGKKQKVVVKGLAPGEKVKVKLRKKKVAAGTANAKGRFAAKFKVRGKLGRAKVKVTGQFPAIRRNSTTFRVVR